MAAGQLREFDYGLINQQPIKLVFPLYDLLDLPGLSNVTTYPLRADVPLQFKLVVILFVLLIHTSVLSHK
jgi:hypothetical protein